MRMRLPRRSFWLGTAVFLAGSICFSVQALAVTLTLTPSSVSNTYTGPISVQITGLTNEEPATIQRFMDLNGNGAVDPGEPLVQRFKVIEGHVTSFGGVRDVNIPGDDDGVTNGQIQTSFSLPTSPELSRGAGKYVVVVSSPNNNFTPATSVLTITQAAFAQGVTGQVASGGTPVAGAAVALLTQVGSDTEFVVGTAADASGNFSLNCAPGNYLLLAIAGGYVYDQSTGPMVSITSGVVSTQNVSLIAATRMITGSIKDTTSNQGVPGVQLFLESTSNKLVLTFSDTNGDFSVPVVADQWKMELSDWNLAIDGYLRSQNKTRADTSTGSVSGVSIPLTRETALIYGYVRNNTNGPLSAVTVNVGDSANLYSASSVTDTNGYYVRGVVAATWSVQPDNASPVLTNYFVAGTNVDVLANQAVQANFTAAPVAAHLRGTVHDDHGNPLGNITLVVQPVPFTNGTGFYPDTDGSGNFDVGLGTGTWNIALECESAQSRGLVNVQNYNYTVVNGVDQNGLSLTFPVATATISGTVTDSFGSPVAGVMLSAISGIYTPGCVMTDVGGNFQIKVINGTWVLSVREVDLNALGYANTTNQSISVNGASQMAYFVAQPFPPSVSQPKVQSGQFQFTLNGFDTRSYRIDASSNCVNWTALATNQTSGGVFNFNDPNTATFNRRFYRAVTVH